jgi:3-hydroxyacyl-[acyl-carrier-protein] dehydratase
MAAASAFSNSLMLSPSLSSHSSPSHRPCSILSPSRSQISLGDFRSLPRATRLKKKNPSHFTTHCSLDAAIDPKEDIPIESSMSFALQLSLSLSGLVNLMGSFLIFCFLSFAGYAAFPTVMDINQIREILPHR